MSRAHKKDAAPQAEELSILDKLLEDHEQHQAEDDFVNDVAVVFTGSKSSGKTSIADFFIKGGKEGSKTNATVSLDYKYARQKSSAMLAHIYEIGGGIESLVDIPISQHTVGNMVIILALDLSKPHSVISDLIHWKDVLSRQIENSLRKLATEGGARGAKRVTDMERKRREFFELHQDFEKLEFLPVPLVIFGTHWDDLAGSVDAEKRKVLCLALRYYAHKFGASLAFTSTKDRDSMNVSRVILRQAIFGVVPKKDELQTQLSPASPICVMAGNDSLKEIGDFVGKDSSPAEFAASLFPNSEQANAVEKAAEELPKEEPIDLVVEQRKQELQKYILEAERKQRLASDEAAVLNLGGLVSAA